jgi:hypothetical protein
MRGRCENVLNMHSKLKATVALGLEYSLEGPSHVTRKSVPEVTVGSHTDYKALWPRRWQSQMLHRSVHAWYAYRCY